MAFVLPTFNMRCGVWRAPHTPPDDPRDTSFECQLRGASHDAATTNPTDFLHAGNYALFPALTDIRDNSTPTGSDILEIPVDSGRYYYVFNVDDVAKGFTNEHRYAILGKALLWPEPIP